ncbi:MAG: LacI family transcriptional regulator [Acidimicrobiia bacterium]|nr:LacI family transcriptional regulator [Acidimicrobiia bacterium]
MSTVSYTLSRTRPISNSTRERVLWAVEQLNYQPNVMAQGLAGSRTGFLALLLPTDEAISDSFTFDIIVAAAETARDRGFHLVLWTEPAGETKGLQDLMRRGLLDGALLLSVRLHDTRVQALQEAAVPLVMIGRNENPADCLYVDSDAAQAADAAIAYLARLGHTNVDYIGPSNSAHQAGFGIVLRVHEALEAATKQLGINLRSAYSDPNAKALETVMIDVLKDPSVTALLALGDSAVVGIRSILQAMQTPVPDYVSVLGLLISTRVTETIWPQLTTITHDPKELGQLGVLTLIDSLDSSTTDVTQILLPSKLNERTTTAAPRFPL